MRKAAIILITLCLCWGALALACDPPSGGINTPPSGGTTTTDSAATTSTVSGTLALTFTVTSETEVTGVDLYIDDAVVTTLTTAPYAYDWDTTKYTNGDHVLYIKIHAKDREDGVSDKVTLTVSNPET